MRYLHFCAHEQFPPDDLLRQAPGAQIERMEEALEMIRALWDSKAERRGRPLLRRPCSLTAG